MTKTKPLSEKNRRRLQHLKQECRRRVVERGIVQFRADAELIEQLLQISDQKKVPVGTLVRQWLVPIIRQEIVNVPVNEIKLKKGKALTKQSNKRDLAAAQYDAKKGDLHLTVREQNTLAYWLSG